MVEIKAFTSLHQISAHQWNNCFANQVEKYEYLLAVEEAGLKGFEWFYITAWQADKMVAAMPAFLNDYKLDTTLQGIGKKITTTLKSAFPTLLTIKLACLGSPCTEALILGFREDQNQKAELLKAMLAEFENFAARRNCKLFGIKDVPETDTALWQPVLTKARYAELSGMPTAYLNIDFANTEEYMLRLSKKTRNNMRNKLKSLNAVLIHNATNITELLPDIIALYYETRNRSDWQFEELTEDYFLNILTNIPTNAFCTLYYAEDKLMAMNLLIQNNEILIDKFFCMNSETGRQYNLYYLSWFQNIEHCLKHGIKRYQSGQANYQDKIRLGSKLIRNSMYFKHRNLFAQGVLKLVAPFFGADETLKAAA